MQETRLLVKIVGIDLCSCLCSGDGGCRSCRVQGNSRRKADIEVYESHEGHVRKSKIRVGVLGFVGFNFWIE